MKQPDTKRSILMINGPNLNMLGTREPEIYGTETLSDIEQKVAEAASILGLAASSYQSNHEGDIIDKIQSAPQCFSGIVYNPGAHAHYSYAIRDAIASISLPVVEIHISNVLEREDFRHNLVISPVCSATIMGHGTDGYIKAVEKLADILEQEM